MQHVKYFHPTSDKKLFFVTLTDPLSLTIDISQNSRLSKNDSLLICILVDAFSLDCRKRDRWVI